MAEIIIRDEKKYRNRRTLRLREYGFNAVISKKVPAKLRSLLLKEEYTLRTNNMGFIENGNNTKSQNRICIIGDSFSECPFMEEKERFVSVCERELNALGHNVELLNCSMTGMNIFHAILTILGKILPLGVSKIIYFTSNSDYQTSRMPDGDFFTHDKSYSIFNGYTENVERGKPAYGNYRKLLNAMSYICKIAKIDFIIALRPFKRGDRRNELNMVTERHADKKGIKYLDLRYFPGENSYYDGTHLTNLASIQFGKYICSALHNLLSHDNNNKISFKIENNPFILSGDFAPARQLKLKERPAMVQIVKKTLGTVDEPYWGDSTFIVETDENSFSDNANNIHSQKKIIVIGDSFMECFFMDPTERLISVAERDLRDTYHCEQEILNATMGGTHLLHAILVFLAKIASMEPSLILYSPSINDYKCLCTPGTFYTKHKTLSTFDKMDFNITAKTKPLYSIFNIYIHIFYSICNIFRHKLVFILRPFHGSGSADMLNRTTVQFCQRRNIEYIDLREFSEDEIIKMHYDRGHLLPEGAQMLGKLLAKKLYVQGLVQPQ